MRSHLTAALVAAFLTFTALADARPGCNTRSCERRVTERHWRMVVAPYRAKLTRVAACESGGRWHIINPPYSGGLQWTAGTWRAAGGRGLAAYASPLEQMFRAIVTMRRRGGWGDWPVCGSR